jgi:hypothetical protein
MEENTSTTSHNQIQNQNEECLELKNIKYKTMLLNGNPIKETKASNDMSNLDNFLENEKNNNSNEPWCKLNKTIKTKKLIDYVSVYIKENDMTESEGELLIAFLKEAMDRKKLQRVKDVIYDKITGIVKEIPALSYTKSTKHFTLKNIDKRLSTIKSLPPISKKTHGTLKNKNLLSIKTNDKDPNDSSSDHEN